MATVQETDKDVVLSIVKDLPDDSTIDDIIRELLVERMVAAADEDYAAGRVLTHAEMVKEVETWFTSSGQNKPKNGSGRSTTTSRKKTRKRRSA